MQADTTDRIEEILRPEIAEKTVFEEFVARVQKGSVTRDEDKESHFCVYFAALDPHVKEVFLGHHKKSGLWLFNGGHIDKGEAPEQALTREIQEEWGLTMEASDIGKPSLLTITYIYDQTVRPCKAHFDIWYFVRVDKTTFMPDQENLATEFYETVWLTVDNAKKIATDENTLHALDIITEKMFSS